MCRRIALIFVALLIPVALVAQMTSRDMSAGTWKLNVEKSKFDPGPAPASATVVIADDGTIKYQEELADGKSSSWSVTPNADGSPAHIVGMGPDDTLAVKKMDDRHFEHTWKIGNGAMTGKSVISKNGKSMTYTLTGTNSDGKTVHDVQIYEKQ